MPPFPRRGHQRRGARLGVSDADQGPLAVAAGGAHPADRVQKGIEGFVGSLQKRAHDRSLHGLTLGRVRVRRGGVDKVVDPAAAAAVSDQAENVLQVVVRHRVGVSRDPYDGAPAEVAAEQILANRRGHEHEPQVRVPGQDAPKYDGEKVGKEVALVELVDDDVRKRLQHLVRAGAGEPAQQHAVGAEHQRAVRARLGLEPDLESDAPGSDVFAPLVGHSLAHGDGGYSPRLRAHDRRAAPVAPRVIYEVLGNLRRLAASRGARHQHNLVTRHRVQNLTLELVHRERRSLSLNLRQSRVRRDPPRESRGAGGRLLRGDARVRSHLQRRGPLVGVGVPAALVPVPVLGFVLVPG